MRLFVIIGLLSLFFVRLFSSVGQPLLAKKQVLTPTDILQNYSILETLSIPLDGRSVTSFAVLQTGVNYKIRTLGIAVAGGPGFTDAEYGFDMSLTNPVDKCSTNGVDFGIAINDSMIDANKSPNWGTFSQSHVYSIDYTGQGSTIDFNYHDCFYTDNAGSLVVEILIPTPGINIETISLPIVDSNPATSTTVLDLNTIYNIRALGITVAGGPGFTDAEHGFTTNGSNILNRCEMNNLDFGIAINEQSVQLDKSTYWGGFNSSHIYSVVGLTQDERIGVVKDL